MPDNMDEAIQINQDGQSFQDAQTPFWAYNGPQIGIDAILGSIAGSTTKNQIPIRVYDLPSAPAGYSNAQYAPDIVTAGTDVVVKEMMDPSPDPNPPPIEYFQERKQTQDKKPPSLTNLNSSYDTARKNAIEDTKESLKGYCFPECNNSEITANLRSLIPEITIIQYNTDTFPELFQNFINGLRGLHNSEILSDIEKNSLSNVYSKLDSTAKPKLPSSINLLFNSLPTKYKNKIVLPITSTPIAINSQLDHGWKANQSIFDFIKKQIGGNSQFSTLFGAMFGDAGKAIEDTTRVVTEITENLMHIFGRDIQLGPYWSLGEGALDNRQTLTFNTILINDTEDHYNANAEVLKSLFVKSQPRAIDGFKIKPPSIFDVEINTCVAGKKKYFLCSGQFGCEAKGRYYKQIPEAYSLSLTFNSLIPDLLKIQQVYGNYERVSKE